VPVETDRIDELRRRVVNDPASVAFAALAEEYRRAGRHDDAISTCMAGLVRHPAYVSARVTLGRALVETGKYDEARVEFEQVLRLAPENLAAIRALAALHERSDDPAPSNIAVSAGPQSVNMASTSAASSQDTQNSPSSSGLPALESFLVAIQKTRSES
jgi:tetratricopeptide (TPR) repeat protein